MSKREKAFALFDEGKNPTSPEVMALGLKANTRYTYYHHWKQMKDKKEEQLFATEFIRVIEMRPPRQSFIEQYDASLEIAEKLGYIKK